ncbi:MAG: hypothetical protein EOP84_02875 [Verrucomicrobiaceae bacterium]|nr:MAG: hypothetical protein EOP84_02875 [Verrucomicrobiaceae bacterium]
MADDTEYDYQTLMGLMYDVEEPAEEPTEKGPAPKNPIMNMATISHKMYRMEKTIEDQDRFIKRLQQRLRNLERANGTITRNLNQMGSDLDNKLDKRGD